MLKWTDKKFIFPANFMIAAVSLYFFFCLQELNDFFEYEIGNGSIEGTIFATDELEEPHSFFYQEYLTEEYKTYHREQCTSRIVGGDLTAEYLRSDTAAQFEKMEGRCSQNLLMNGTKSFFTAMIPIHQIINVLL